MYRNDLFTRPSDQGNCQPIKNISKSINLIKFITSTYYVGASTKFAKTHTNETNTNNKRVKYKKCIIVKKKGIKYLFFVI